MLWLSSMKQCISSAPFVVGVKNSFMRFRSKIMLYVRCRELHKSVRCYVSFHFRAKAAKHRSPSGRTLRKWSDHLPHFLSIAMSRTQSRAEMHLTDRIGSDCIWVALPYSFLLDFSNFPVQVRKHLSPTPQFSVFVPRRSKQLSSLLARGFHLWLPFAH